MLRCKPVLAGLTLLGFARIKSNIFKLCIFFWLKFGRMVIPRGSCGTVTGGCWRVRETRAARHLRSMTLTVNV